jgi:hypothetical protein
MIEIRNDRNPEEVEIICIAAKDACQPTRLKTLGGEFYGALISDAKFLRS